jgi:hypothetical protein
VNWTEVTQYRVLWPDFVNTSSVNR